MALKFEITGDNRNLLSSLDGAREGVRKAAKDIEESGLSIEDMFKRIAAAAGIAFTLDQAKNFVKSVMDMRGQFQQLEIAFNTMLQSEEKATMLMSQLVDTAAKTPFDLQGVAQGAKQLLAYGIAADEVNEIITRLGDIAAGLSIPLGDLVYLYGTTMTQGRMFTMDLRQFMGRGIPMAEELAKQFGVTKNEVAGLVTAGQVGADAVKQAIWDMTNEGSRFGGLMSEQSKSITGQISNIEDAFDTMLNDIGKSNEGLINDGLDGVKFLIENYEEVGRVLLGLVAAYGEYKAALMVTSAIQKSMAKQANEIEATRQAELQAVYDQFSSDAEVQAEEASSAAIAQNTASREGNVTAIDSQIAALERKMIAEIEEQNNIYKTAKESLDVLKKQEAQKDSEIETLKEQISTSQEYIDGEKEAMEAALSLGDAEEAESIKTNIATESKRLENLQGQLGVAQKEKNIIADQRHSQTIATKTALTQKQTMQEKLSNMQKAVSVVQTKAQTTATGLWVAVTKSATAAMNSLKAAMMSNPFGLALAAVTTLITLLPMFSSETSKASEEIERFGESAVKQTRNLETLMAVVDNTSKDSMVHKDAVDDLCKIYEEYGFKIDDEIDKLQQLKDMHDLVTDAIHREGEERQKANLLQSYNEALEEATTNMRDALQNAFESAEWDASGTFDDFDADEYQEKAKELTHIIGAIIQSESDALATLTGDELEAKISEVNDRIKKAYEDMGLQLSKSFVKSGGTQGAQGYTIDAPVDVDAIQIMRDYAEATHSVTEGRKKLIESFERGKKSAEEEKKEIDYTKLSIADLAKTASEASENISDLGDKSASPTVDKTSIDKANDAATTAKKGIDLLNGTTAKPLVDTSSIGFAIGQTNTLLGNMFQLQNFGMGGGKSSFSLGFNPNQFGFGKTGQFNLFGGKKPVWVTIGGKSGVQWMPDIPITDPAILAQMELNNRVNGANTQKKVDDLLKEVNDALSSAVFDSTEYKNLEALKKRLEAKSRKGSKSSKGNKADKIKKLEDQYKLKKELAQREVDLELETRQAYIDAMEEGSARELAQLRLDFEKRQEELKRGYEDLREKKIEQEKKLFEANPANKDKTFAFDINSSKYAPTVAETALYDKQKANNLLEYYRRLEELTSDFQTNQQEREEKTRQLTESVKAITEALNAEKAKGNEADSEAVKLLEERLGVARVLLEISRANNEELEFLMKYGDAQTRISAIQQNYGNRISEASAKGDTYGAMTLKKQMEEEISAVNFEDLKRKINWEALFGDLSSVTRKELETLKGQLEEFIGSKEFDKAGEEVRRSALEGINAVDAAIQESGGVLASLANARQARASAVERLVKAELDEQMAEISLELARGMGDNVAVAEASAKLAEKQHNTDQARKDVQNADKNLKALSDGRLEKLAKEFELLRGALSPVIDLFDSLGMSGVGTVFSGLGDALSSATSTFSSFTQLKDMFKEGSAIGDLLGNAGPYAAAASAAFSLGKTVYSMAVSSLDNHEEMMDVQHEANARLGLIDDHVQEIRSDMGESFGVTAIGKYEELVDALKSQFSYMNTGVQAAGNDRYGGTHSEWWHRNRNGGEDLVAAIGRYYGMDFGDNSLQSFYNQLEGIGERGAEILDDIRRNHQDWWYDLTRDNSYDEGAIGKWVEQWADVAGQLKDAREQLREILSGTTEEDVFSDFMNNVYEFADGAEDAFDDVADSWQRMVNRMVVNNLVGQKMKENLKKWYKQFSEAYEDKEITKTEIDNLRSEYDGYIQDARDEIERLRSMGVVTSMSDSDYSQQASARGFQSMGQDTAEELNGHFTALQIAGENVATQVMSIYSQMVAMSSVNTSSNMFLQEIRNMMITTNSYLDDISKYSRKIYLDFAEKLDDVIANTKNL